MSRPRSIPVIIDRAGLVHRIPATGAGVGTIACKGSLRDFVAVTEAQTLEFGLTGCPQCWNGRRVVWPKATVRP